MPFVASVVRSSVIASALLALPGIVSAQAPAAKAPTCTSLFTAAELAQTVGGGFKDMGPEERHPGETECSWMARGGATGFQTVSLQFYDLRAIKDANQTPAAFFETVVDGAEGMASGKRQPLPGIGQQAVFVPTDPQALAVVLRADGVARIVGNNISKAQITAIAKAVAAP